MCSRIGGQRVTDAMATEQRDDREQSLEPLILLVRGRRVIADLDLARIYGVETRVLNQAMKRNLDRFPEDFAFQLDEEDMENLRSQLVISSSLPNQSHGAIWAQIVTTSHGGTRTAPWVFSEHGALMVANVLRSRQAIEMSIFVIRAFVRIREQLSSSAEILKRLAEIDLTLLQHDAALRDVYRKLLPLLASPAEPAKRRIGF
jgi:hypothetical protein